jgi:drug/metabolite transporter (DMT)-like permease
MVNFVAFAVALVFVDFSRITFSWYWAAFLGAGISSPALSLLFMYRSIQHIGVAPTNSIINTHAFFGPFLAYFILGERPHPGIWLGIVIVILGVYLLIGGGDLRQHMRHIWLPFMTAICFAMAHNLRKVGFGGMDSLLFGGFLQGASSAAVAPLVLKMATRGQPYVFNRQSLGFFWWAGVGMVLAQFSLLYALRWGQIALIGPIMATGPLIALVLTYTMLGGREKLTTRIVIGACLMVLGVLIVTSLK